MNVSFEIKRVIDGTEHKIVLTESELRNAYALYEYKLDYEWVEGQLDVIYCDDEFEDSFGIPRSDITEDMVSDIAMETRRQIDKYGLDDSDALINAIKICIKNKQ